MQKFTKQLSKDDLKKYAKEVGKKLVASDFKHGRVEDPTKISEKQEKKVKKYVKDYFEKVVQKKSALDKRKREKEEMAASAHGTDGINVNGTSKEDPPKEDSDGEDEEVDLTPNSPIPELAPSPSIPTTPLETEGLDLKRKRTGEDTPDDDSNKRFKDEDVSPPPPPPPPPADSMPDASMLNSDFPTGESFVKEDTEEARELRKQEEDLMKENEEAMKMDLDVTLKKEGLDQKPYQHPLHQVHVPKDPIDGINGTKVKREGMMSH